MLESEGLISIAEAVKILGRSKAAVTGYYRSNKLSSKKIGNRRFIYMDSVKKFLSKDSKFKGEEWLSTQQAAKALGVSEKAIYNYIAEGLLEHEKWISRLYIPAESIEGFEFPQRGGSRGDKNWEPPQEEIQEMEEALMDLICNSNSKWITDLLEILCCSKRGYLNS